MFWCPGCKCGHYVRLGATKQDPQGPIWQWNQNKEKPTFNPSVKTKGVILCHLLIKDGMIQFCSDCQHKLAGQTVPMVDMDKMDMDKV